MGVAEKLRELEAELARTQKNKATEYHIGILKSKIAQLKREQISPSKKGGAGAGGFDVKKSGDSTVVFIGLPSTGKSSLLNVMTNRESRVAAFAFTTLTCIPAVMHYRGAKIQLLDLPGVIAGASSGKGRGREVLAVARNADLVLLVVDVFQPGALDLLKRELEGIGIRLDQKPPQIFFSKALRGGLVINSTVKLTKMTPKMIEGIMGEFGEHNGNLTLREDITPDQLIDFLSGNRRYIDSLTILNKTDLVTPEYLKTIKFPCVPVSAERKVGIEGLREKLWDRLSLIRIYTKPRMAEADLKEPMMMRMGSTIGDACDKLHRDLRKNFRYAQIWGPSAKFPGQKGGLTHALKDGDVITIISRECE